MWLLLLAVGAALLRLQRQRFVAVVLTGAVGLVASLAFIALSAPDLALTQLSVDVVSTVLLLMGLALLPQTSPRESRAPRRCATPLLALAGGVGMAALDLADADARPSIRSPGTSWRTRCRRAAAPTWST